MDDETQQTSQEVFDQIILGLALIGLAGGGIAWAVDGLASPWFLRSGALLIIVLIAFILRRVGQFVIAAYVSVLELLGLVAGMFFEADALTGFEPYFFIPVVIIASLILTPNAAIAITLFAIGLALAIVFVTGQFTGVNFMALLPPFGLVLLTAFLATLSGSTLLKLNRRLAESSKLLRERTLDLIKFKEKVNKLQGNIVNLEQQLAQTQAEVNHTRRTAAQKDRRLHDLIRDMLQELKSAVSKLERGVETIAAMPHLETQPDVLNQAWQKLDHLTRLVINMDELIQLEHDDLHLEFQTVDVAQFLQELVGVMGGLAREKNLELRCSISPDLPPLEADPIRLRQALLHVLGNAVKYTNQGVIEVQTELAGHELLIYVSDTGVGMPVETVKALFYAPIRENNRPGKIKPGPGLGLAITKRLIELHGGRIWATSVPEVGSTFSIALPLSAPQIDLLTTVLSAKPFPTVVATRDSTRTLVSPALLETESPQLIQSASKETILSATAPGAIPVAPSGHTRTPPELLGQNRPGATSLPPSTSVRPSFQVTLPPVARFSSTYINRFGLTLLGMLLIIIATVAVLAWVNGPSQRKATPTRAAQASGNLVATSTPALSPKIEPEATKVPAVMSQPTQTPRPIPTRPPTSTPSPRPTATPIGARPLPEQTGSIQQTPSSGQLSRATATSLPTRRAEAETQTPPPTPTSTLEPTPVEAAPSPVVSPAVKFNPPDLSFVTGLSTAPPITLLSFNSSSGIGLVAITSVTAHSGLSWRQGQALFSGEVNGNYDLYLAQPGKSSPINLTLTGGDDLQPAWSPDGRQIAFSSGRSGNLDIYVVSRVCVGGAGGCENGLVQLTTSRGFDEWPAWSPDGRQIAFVSDRDGNVEIYVMSSDGSDQQRLTDHPGDDWPAAWSPDGHHLVFASNRDGNWNLYLIEASGGEPIRLTSDPGNEREPAWSPDGRTIAFAYLNNDNWDIYTLPAPTGPTPDGMRSAISEVPRSAWTQIALTATDERYPTWLEH